MKNGNIKTAQKAVFFRFNNMILRILLLTIFLSCSIHLMAQEKCCDWVENDILPTAPQKRYDTLSYNESLTQWEYDKNKHHNSYTYLMGSPNNYTQIEVQNGKVISRKHYSSNKTLKEIKYTCQPDYYQCPIVKKIDSLRNKNKQKYFTSIQHHDSIHAIFNFRLHYFNCWEEYWEKNEFVSKDDRFTYPAKTVEELYEDCSNILRQEFDGVHKLGHEFTVNKKGYICSCYSISPFYTAHGELPKDGLEIINFRWNDDDENVHNKR